MKKVEFQNTDTYKHLLKINNSLWKNKHLGNVSLMIGAGFSMNSVSLIDKSRMPSWIELGDKILRRLYPETLHCTDTYKKLSSQYSGPTGAVELAGEYAELHGEAGLDKLIEEEIKDHHFLPTALHNDVLEFPWADIFTTNYDTLLEKALKDNIGQRYEVIKSAKHIPDSVQPRIFKLHGSISDSTPYIITEEQYRTYPENYAPFVNSVLQSMMENVLCLIGFSGKDPNFTKWTGWIKDNLKKNSPTIYLIGIIDDLTTSQKLLLKRRNVEVVNLLDAPEIQKGQHKEALQFFFSFLRSNKKLSPKNWLASSDDESSKFESINKLLKTDIKTLEIRPSNEREFSKHDFEKITQKWELERKRYFSWPHLHSDIRSTLYNNTSTYIHDFFNSSRNAKKSFFKELCWRMNRANFHVYENWYKVLEDHIFKNVSEEDQELLIFLISDDRFCKNIKKHERNISLLKSISKDNEFISYLELRELTELGKFENANKLVEEIKSEHHSIESYLAISWFYYQIDSFKDAYHYSTLALERTRSILSLQKDDPPYFLYIENCAQYQLFHITQKLGSWPKFKDYKASEVSKEVMSDIVDIRDQLDSELRNSIDELKKDQEENTGFDVGSSSVSYNSHDFFAYKKSHFYSLYMFCVNSYLQVSFLNKELSIRNIKFSFSYNEMSSLNLIVNTKNRDVTKATLSKKVVMSLSDDTIYFWITNITNRIQELLNVIKNYKKTNSFNSTLFNDFNNSLEVVSRLVLRTSSESSYSIFKFIYEELEKSNIIQNSFNTIESVNSLLRRCANRMNIIEIEKSLIIICKLPTFDDGFSKNERKEFYDPIFYILNKKPQIIKTDKLNNEIDNLLKRAIDNAPQNMNLLVRLHFLFVNDILSTSQITLFEEALWKDISFPQDINSFFSENDHQHLLIYTPRDGSIDHLKYLKTKILSLKPKPLITSKSSDEQIKKVPIGSNIGHISFFSLLLFSSKTLHSNEHYNYIQWSDVELDLLLEVSLSFWTNENRLLDKRKTSGFFATDKSLERRYYNIPHILATSILPFMNDEKTPEKIKDLFIELQSKNVPCMILLPYLFSKKLISLEELKEKISFALSSSEYLHQNDAFLAIYQWVSYSRLDQVTTVSNNVINDIILYFYRTSTTLSYAGTNLIYKMFKLSEDFFDSYESQFFKAFKDLKLSTDPGHKQTLSYFSKIEEQAFDIQYEKSFNITETVTKILNLPYIKNKTEVQSQWSDLV